MPYSVWQRYSVCRVGQDGDEFDFLDYFGVGWTGHCITMLSAPPVWRGKMVMYLLVTKLAYFGGAVLGLSVATKIRIYKQLQKDI